jgi:hypothetical protein
MTPLHLLVRRLPPVAWLALGLCATPAWAKPNLTAPLPPPGNRGYAFAYRFTGPPRSYPIQAFRGRHALYVQYPHGARVRRAQTWRGGRYHAALLMREGPYYAIVPAAVRTRVTTGQGTAVIWQAGGVPAIRHRTAVSVTVVRPSSVRTSAGIHPAGRPAGAKAGGRPLSRVVTPQVLTMMLRAQRLSTDMRRFLNHHEWHLAWRTAQDYAVPYPYSLHGPNVVAVLRQLAALYRLRVHIYRGNRVAVVTMASPLTVRRLPHAR